LNWFLVEFDTRGLGKRGPQPDSRSAGNAVAKASFRLGRRLRYVYGPVFLS
jgi:hypothetical protein